MQLTFYKYQGTGNDFIMVDNRNNAWTDVQENDVKALCDRKFGIGADGLILLTELEGFDFEMIYFNSDGRESSMCGNGGRCISQFAFDLGINRDVYKFMAIDGEHQSKVTEDKVSLKMIDVNEVVSMGNDFFTDTGSPHHIVMSGELNNLKLMEEARAIRYSEPYKERGVNVNFVNKISDGLLEMRTYERGVEDETLSCGTGVTAAAIIAGHKEEGEHHVRINTAGGELSVSYVNKNGSFYDIWLTGPAKFVFKGEIEV